MYDRYTMNSGVISAEEQSLLKHKTVFIAGLGGTGGYVAEHLARLGVGTIKAADGDVFNESNLNRQICCNESNLSMSKAVECEKRIKSINSDIGTVFYNEHLTVSNTAALISGSDIVIDALDNISSRRILSSACDELTIPLIHTAVSGMEYQVSVIPPMSGDLDVIYKSNTLSSIPCPSFVPACAASVAVSEAIKLLLDKDNILKDRLLIADMLTHQQVIIKLR